MSNFCDMHSSILGHDGIDMSYFSLPNYTMENQNRRLSAHGGLITYIHDDFAYRELNNMFPVTVISKLFESLFIEIWRTVLKDRNILSLIYIAYHLASLMMWHHLLKSTQTS